MTKRIALAAACLAALGLLAAPQPASAGVADCGMLTNFASVTFMTSAGAQVEPTYAVTAAVRIATPNIVVSKVATPTMQGAGGTVVFCINFQNLSFCASAINVLITDKVPDSMNFVVVAYDDWTSGPNDGTMTSENSTNGGATWNAGAPGAVGSYLLRWSYSKLAPRESGVICFRASVL